jgi:hypothetical protein
MPMPADDDAAAAGRGQHTSLDLLVPQRIHIIGIGGAGMSAIAIVLRSRDLTCATRPWPSAFGPRASTWPSVTEPRMWVTRMR